MAKELDGDDIGYKRRVATPNVQSEPRAWLAHFVLLGARNVTAMLVGSTALLGSVFISDNVALQIEAELFLSSREHL